jgi:hypothetical protein
MGVDAARERLQVAGRRLRERPREQTLESLASWLDEGSRPESALQQQLARDLPDATGFSPENVREGVADGLASWTGDALRALVDREARAIGPDARLGGFETTSTLLAGSIPMPTLLSLIAPLLLHSPVLARTASRDPVSAQVFHESLSRHDPELAAAIEIVSFPSHDTAALDTFLDSPCVVATGSDETVDAVAARVRAGTRLVRYGHRVSVAAVAAPAMNDATARALARDVGLWDQLGCLSPIALFCVGGDVEAFAAAIARALADRERTAPLGELPPEAAARVRAERDGAEMRRAAGADVDVHASPTLRYTVVRESDRELRPAPLHRFLRVHPVAHADELLEVVAPLSRHLAAVAIAGFEQDEERVARALAGRGASRVCAPGRMQTPPIGWHHDNQPVLLPLARVADLETGR